MKKSNAVQRRKIKDRSDLLEIFKAQKTKTVELVTILENRMT